MYDVEFKMLRLFIAIGHLGEEATLVEKSGLRVVVRGGVLADVKAIFDLNKKLKALEGRTSPLFMGTSKPP
ncbi:hypothetical protein SRHO_G00157390 [Serrasalmus rhombeus]